MQVSLDLMEFIEQQILPRYNQFDPAHNISHANAVIRRSLQIADKIGADPNMVYVVAAYHDLGLSGPRAIHHVTGAKILAADKRLCKWFSTEQIRIMQEAVADHRASAAHAPRSLYGRIVAEADRDLRPEIVFRRTVQFGLSHYPELDQEQQWERFKQHIQHKYGPSGYIHLWIENSENQTNLAQLRKIISDEKELRQAFLRFYQEERCYKE